MNDTINLLDFGHIRLVDKMGSDLSIVRAARVSYDAEWRAGEDDAGDRKLINYLWKNLHTSPFEAGQLAFDIKAPIFVFRQWHRHRTWSYNELSARYRELPEEFYVPKVEDIGLQSKDNKQGRYLVVDGMAGRKQERELFVDTCQNSFQTYKKLLAADWPRELARSVLPCGTYSHMFGNVSLLNAFRFMTLRSDPHAQKEIKVYSDAMLELIEPHFPVACKSFRRWKWKPVDTSECQ